MTRIAAALLLSLLALPAWAERAVVSSARGANVYSASGKRAAKIHLLGKNAEVEMLDEKDGRVHVRFQGGEGWVSRDTLRELPAAEPAAKPRAAPAAVEEPKAAPVPPPPAVPAAPPPAVAVPAAAPPSAAPPPEGTPAPSAKAGSDREYLAQELKEEPLKKVETGSGFVSVLGSLLLVLALVAGAVYGFKVFAARRLVVGGKSKGIQVLATRPLGPRQGLLLVEVGGLPLLLAQSEGMVNLIAEIRDAEAVERLNDLYGFKETPFESELRSRLDLESGDEPTRRAGSPAVEAEGGPSAGLSSEDRLSALRRRRRLGEDT